MKKKFLPDKCIILLISFCWLMPLVLTFLYSIFCEWTRIVPTGFTLRYYKEIFTDSVFLAALVRSVIIAIIPVVLITVLMLLVTYVMILYVPDLNQVVSNLANIPYALQGVILSVTIIGLYAGAPGWLSNRFLLLTGAYCILVLPYIYRGIKNSIDSINVKAMVDAAQMLGATKWRAFIAIILPQMKTGILVAMMLSMSMIFGDFVIVNTIGGSYFTTAGIYLYKQMAKSGQKSSSMIVVLFITTLIISGIMSKIEQKQRKQKGER